MVSMSPPSMGRSAYFLPKPKRDAIAALELFVRDMRGALAGQGDCCGGTSSCGPSNNGEGANGGLADRAVEQLYAGRVEATMGPLADLVRETSVPRQWFVSMLHGFACEGRVSRYATWASLEKQLAQTGGNIARIASAIIGSSHSDAGTFAEKVGVATMLVSLLRSMKADAEGGRVTLPLEDLARSRYSERQWLAGESNDALRELVRSEVARARDLLRDGSTGICWLAGDGSRLAASAFIAARLGELDAVERAGYDVLQGDLNVSPARKLRQWPVAWRLAKRAPDEPMPRVS